MIIFIRYEFVQTLRELQKDLGELGHKKKSETKPEEIDQLLKKYDVKRKKTFTEQFEMLFIQAVKKRRKKQHRGKGGSKKKKQSTE